MNAKKTPWFLRFAGKLKTAAAVVVGIGLLVGSTGEIHGQGDCDPPVFDVCFHKSNWTSAGYATMYIEVDLPPAESGQRYELVWRGLKKIFVDGVLEETYRDDSKPGLSASSVYDKFWWPSWVTKDSYVDYMVEIYEGHWDFGNEVNGRPTWVRDTWIGSAQLYSYQEAAEVNLNASLYSDFDLWTYYCTIDWDTPLANLRYGYILGSWTYDNSRQEFFYEGVHGSPRFDYEDDCSYEFSPRKYIGGFSSYSINPYGPPLYPY